MRRGLAGEGRRPSHRRRRGGGTGGCDRRGATATAAGARRRRGIGCGRHQAGEQSLHHRRQVGRRLVLQRVGQGRSGETVLTEAVSLCDAERFKEVLDARLAGNERTRTACRANRREACSESGQPPLHVRCAARVSTPRTQPVLQLSDSPSQGCAGEGFTAGGRTRACTTLGSPCTTLGSPCTTLGSPCTTLGSPCTTLGSPCTTLGSARAFSDRTDRAVRGGAGRLRDRRRGGQEECRGHG